MKQFTFLWVLLLATTANAFSQSTYNLIYNIFQSQCTGACHSGSAPDAQLDLSAAPATVYNGIVNVNPVNATALAKGDKLIAPGYPHRSFLLRKCDHALDPHSTLDAQEGELMPGDSIPMDVKDLELIRQWILFGAPQTGNPVDTSIINKYYNGKGITSPAVPYPVPAEEGAFQIHVGKLFVAPASEFQFYLKQDLNLQDTIEVTRLDATLGSRAHHFNMLKFNPGAAATFDDGLRGILETSHLSAAVIGAFQHSYDLELPAGTAYQWEAGIVLDINFHIINPSPDSVLAVDLYINVYTQPKGTAEHIMKIKWYSNFTFAIPWDNSDHKFTAIANDPNEEELWEVWMMSSHTHKYGKDFDVYFRNSDGTEGDQIYEGYSNEDHTFNQGFYDWQHPPRKYFQDYLPVNPKDGFIYKTTYKNSNGPALVLWGATAADEMMIMYVHYIDKREPTLVIAHDPNPLALNLFPNPANDRCGISYTLSENSKVTLEVLDAVGEKVAVIASGEPRTEGKQTQTFDVPSIPGFYFVRLTSGNDVQVKAFVVAR